MDPVDTCDHCGEVKEVQFIDGDRVCVDCTTYLIEAMGQTEEEESFIMKRFMKKE